MSLTELGRDRDAPSGVHEEDAKGGDRQRRQIYHASKEWKRCTRFGKEHRQAWPPTLKTANLRSRL